MTLFETITEFVGLEAPSTLLEIIFVSCADFWRNTFLHHDAFDDGWGRLWRRN